METDRQVTSHWHDVLMLQMMTTTIYHWVIHEQEPVKLLSVKFINFYWNSATSMENLKWNVGVGGGGCATLCRVRHHNWRFLYTALLLSHAFLGTYSFASLLLLSQIRINILNFSPYKIVVLTICLERNASLSSFYVNFHAKTYPASKAGIQI